MKEFDSIISVTEEHWLPRWSLNGTPVEWDPENRPMRQEMDLRYAETGASTLRQGKIFGIET